MGWLTPIWSFEVALAVFAVAATVVAVAGAKLVSVVDRIADVTGLGEAVTGAVFLAGATSLAGLVATIVAAAEGNASLAVSNSTGGIAAQTVFIVVADLVYRPANIEHAAASLTNLLNGFLVVVLLALVAAGMAAPDWAIAGIHPVTGLIFFAYVYGVSLARSVGREAMWVPRRTAHTREDMPDEESEGLSLAGLIVRFAVLALVVAAGGWTIARAGLSLIAATGLGGTAVGVLFTSIATSTPELVTTVAAVRTGALTLAVAGIVGGNTFDVLFVAAADVTFREQSIYGAAAASDAFVVAWTIALIGVVGAGLVRRQREGIGFEGVGVIALYALGAATVVAMA